MATTLGEKAVGSIVKLNINGTATEFIIVQQGRPSTAYDSSCNGTWLLMKNIHSIQRWHSSSDDNPYASSEAHSYLNNTFINLIASDIRSYVKTVKIPYLQNGSSSSVSTLSTKCFFLSFLEVGYSLSSEGLTYGDGSVLSYFKNASNSTRIAYYNGTAAGWWLRTPWTGDGPYYAWNVDKKGAAYHLNVTSTYPNTGFRPALILPTTLYVLDDGSLSIEEPKTFSGYATIGGVNKELSGGYANIGGTWKEVSGMYMNIGDTWKEMV